MQAEIAKSVMFKFLAIIELLEILLRLPSQGINVSLGDTIKIRSAHQFSGFLSLPCLYQETADEFDGLQCTGTGVALSY